MIGRGAFNLCFRLRRLFLEQGSRVHKVGGFAGSALTSIMFPPSLGLLSSNAFHGSLQLWLITFKDGSTILRIDRTANKPAIAGFPGQC
jgi:hypothetical protein